MPRPSHVPTDFVTSYRSLDVELVGGRGHYDAAIEAVLAAETSVWIATANLKELMIEDGRARPGVRRARGRSSYRSILEVLADHARRGVELRVLHADRPSGPFRAELARHPVLDEGGLALRLCPRNHMKAVIVDGRRLYLGSANWTGAGLGARGATRRNFELGVMTEDTRVLDHVQGLYQHLWSGGACGACGLRERCPGPLDLLEQLSADVPAPAHLAAGSPAAPGSPAAAASPAAPATVVRVSPRRRAKSKPTRRRRAARPS
ncbi:MAG: phospholipase [Myxococcales bacterium]|nr:phospholipase [Myxococcales bacterium]